MGICWCLFLNGSDRYIQRGGKSNVIRNNSINFYCFYLSLLNQICVIYCWIRECEMYCFSLYLIRKFKNVMFFLLRELRIVLEFFVYEMLIKFLVMVLQKLLVKFSFIVFFLFLVVLMWQCCDRKEEICIGVGVLKKIKLY